MIFVLYGFVVAFCGTVQPHIEELIYTLEYIYDLCVIVFPRKGCGDTPSIMVDGV